MRGILSVVDGLIMYFATAAAFGSLCLKESAATLQTGFSWAWYPAKPGLRGIT
jgi:hypothetical protein